jgi:hypothetical protein
MSKETETEIWEANKMIWLSNDELDEWAEDKGEGVPTIFICQACYDKDSINGVPTEWGHRFVEMLNELDTDDYIDFFECDEHAEYTDEPCEFCGHEVTK